MNHPQREMTLEEWVNHCLPSTHTARKEYNKLMKELVRHREAERIDKLRKALNEACEDVEQKDRLLNLKLPQGIMVNGIIIGKGCTLETVAHAIMKPNRSKNE